MNLPDPLARPPAAVVEIAQRLEEAGFETWCVGGAVRDALLGLAHLDWDFATAAHPPDVRRLFRRTVPLGIEHGTVGVLDSDGRMHEVTTFRRDVQTNGRHAAVEFGATLDEDLARRDFTINAIAFSPISGELRDPYAGRADLARGVVRAVGDPRARMAEDRLRALRAIRFAARYAFRIDGATWRAIVESAPHLGRLSAERVVQELEKTMSQVERPGRALALWRDAGALRTLIPPLADVSDLSLDTLDQLPRARTDAPRGASRTLNRLTALFGEVDASALPALLHALRFSRAQASWIAETVARWRTLAPQVAARLLAGRPRNVEIRRWVAQAGRTRVTSVFRLVVAEVEARRQAGARMPDPLALASLYRRAVRSAFRDPVELGDLAVDGDDLRASGIPPGPGMGQVLRTLLDEVLEDPSRNVPDRLVARARTLMLERSEEP